MAYQMYRQTTLGSTLQESLNELIEDGTIPKSLADRVMLTFDKSINNALANRARNKMSFKAEKLVAYRFCDNVWTFVVENVEFKGMPSCCSQPFH